MLTRIALTASLALASVTHAQPTIRWAAFTSGAIIDPAGTTLVLGQAFVGRSVSADGSVVFDAGIVPIIYGNACRADLNNDGTLTIIDILEYFDLFIGQDARADVNSDDLFDINDIIAYFALFAAGC